MEAAVWDRIKKNFSNYQFKLKHSKMLIETLFRTNEQTILRASFTELIPETLKYDEDAIKDIIADIYYSAEEVKSN